MVLQQFGGVNGIVFYASSIFESAGNFFFSLNAIKQIVLYFLLLYLFWIKIKVLQKSENPLEFVLA